MQRSYFATDLLPAVVVLIVGISEAVHLCGVFLGLPFHLCALLLGGAAAALAVALAVLWVLLRRRSVREGVRRARQGGVEIVLLILFAAVVGTQLYFVVANQEPYRQGDMTVETVGSFLQTDGIYRVNPVTGQAYRQGIPSRLKILCLPTLYGAMCSLFGVSPQTLVWRIVPVLTLLACFSAYASLGSCLFAENLRKRRCFLAAVALLLWAGAYLYGMDGFGVLYSGWRGVTLRNAVLLPWLLSLCLRKKWLWVLACILAEACIVWTLYGMGACLFVAAGLKLAGIICDRTERRSDGEETAK